MGFNTGVRLRDGGDRLEFGAGGELDFGDMVHVWDDFTGDLLRDEWGVQSGSDAQAVDPAINAAVGGTVRLTTGNAGTGVAADGSLLSGELIWKANQGGLKMEARLKMDAITDVVVNVGFTDTKALELPFEIGSSDALTSNATDAVCFVFDTGADTDKWHVAGVKNDTDAGPTDSGTAPTADTYQTFRIEIDSSGNADFWLDDSHVTQLSNAVTAGTAITPVVVAMADSTTSRNIDVDYVWVRMDR